VTTKTKKISVHFKIKPFSRTYNFYVVDYLPYKAITGLDFMKFVKMTINTYKGQFPFDFGERVSYKLALNL